jgi:hypothetical protein
VAGCGPWQTSRIDLGVSTRTATVADAAVLRMQTAGAGLLAATMRARVMAIGGPRTGKGLTVVPATTGPGGRGNRAGVAKVTPGEFASGQEAPTLRRRSGAGASGTAAGVPAVATGVPAVATTERPVATRGAYVVGVGRTTTGGTNAAAERQGIDDLAARTQHQPGFAAAKREGAGPLRRRSAIGDRRAAVPPTATSL